MTISACFCDDADADDGGPADGLGGGPGGFGGAPGGFGGGLWGAPGGFGGGLWGAPGGFGGVDVDEIGVDVDEIGVDVDGDVNHDRFKVDVVGDDRFDVGCKLLIKVVAVLIIDSTELCIFWYFSSISCFLLSKWVSSSFPSSTKLVIELVIKSYSSLILDRSTKKLFATLTMPSNCCWVNRLLILSDKLVIRPWRLLSLKSNFVKSLFILLLSSSSSSSSCSASSSSSSSCSASSSSSSSCSACVCGGNVDIVTVNLLSSSLLSSKINLLLFIVLISVIKLAILLIIVKSSLFVYVIGPTISYNLELNAIVKW